MFLCILQLSIENIKNIQQVNNKLTYSMEPQHNWLVYLDELAYSGKHHHWKFKIT